jgi:predicted metal-dependent phosphoesterase TrpH
MRSIKLDMHIHTCLSPCAEISISPKRIVEKAVKCGFDMIFITDHNSMENSEAAMRASLRFESLKVYPGMEVTSKEEVHTLALFKDIASAYNTQRMLHRHLANAANQAEFTEQIIANEFDEVEGYSAKSLFSAVDMSVNEIVELIHSNKGLAVAAHIDRDSFSVISQLGFIPDDISFDALEVSPNTSLEMAKEKFKQYSNKYNFVSGSDSHFLDNFGEFFMEFEGEDNSFESFASFIKKCKN